MPNSRPNPKTSLRNPTKTIQSETIFAGSSCSWTSTSASSASVSTSVVVKEGHRLLRRGQQCLLCLLPFQADVYAIIVPSLCQSNPAWLGLKPVGGCGSCAGVSAVHLMAPPQVKASRAVLADRAAISIRKRRRDALEAASVAAAFAAAAAVPVHPPSSSESNSPTASSTGTSSTPTLPSLPNAPPPIPTATQPSTTTATTTNIAKPSSAGAAFAVEAMTGNQLEQLQQLRPLLAALMADQKQEALLEMPLPMPPPPPKPPPPPPWRLASGVHACPALRLALRLGRVPDASSPSTPTASCALCGEELPDPAPSSAWITAASPAASPPTFPTPMEEATPRSPQQGGGARATAAATTSPRLAVTSITMPDVVAQHLPQQRCHQRRVRHLPQQRQRRATFEGQSPRRGKRPRPKTSSSTKQSNGPSTSQPTNQSVNQSDSDSEDVSLAARMRAMRLAAAGGDVDPGLPPPPWATSSTGCSDSECDSGGSGSKSGAGSSFEQVTPMPTVGLRGLKLEPIKKQSSEEVEPAALTLPQPPLKLRRYLLREKLAKQRPRTAAAVSASRVTTILPVSVDPVTMMGWVPPRTLTRTRIGRMAAGAGVRASRPLLRTSNSTESSY